MKPGIYYVLKYVKFRYYSKMLGAVMLLVLLPPTAFGMGTLGLLAILPSPADEIIKNLGDKNLGYWFVALAGIAITSWTFVGKWLLKQLEQQRVANGDITTKLIGYMERDHSAMITVITELSTVQKQTVNLLEKVSEKLTKT